LPSALPKTNGIKNLNVARRNNTLKKPRGTGV
jgi:hypothetical protein